MKVAKLARFFTCVLIVSGTAYAQEFKRGEDCKVGARVADRDRVTSVVIEVNGSMCKVKYDSPRGSETTGSYLFWMLRPASGQSPATPSSPAAAKSAKEKPDASGSLPTGLYKCYMLTGGTLNYAFIDVQIDSKNSYRDKQGGSGRYRIEANDTLVFETGSLKAANAKILSGPRIGLNMNGGNFFNTTCSLKN
jgi:hypothetical protein